jgi:hypothetical protein
MKVFHVHFIKMLNDTNWDKGILSPPLKELCYFYQGFMFTIFLIVIPC